MIKISPQVLMFLGRTLQMRMIVSASCFIHLLLVNQSYVQAVGTPLDKSLKPSALEAEEVSPTLEDMGVVQRRMIQKSKKILVSAKYSLDFADGPYSINRVNFDLGYSFSENWEVYLTTTPIYMISKRLIAQQIETLRLEDGNFASINVAIPKKQFGLEVLWALLYGKESLGLRTLLRSDTFVKFGVLVIQYDRGNGTGLNLGLGKTFFPGKSIGIRLIAEGNLIRSDADRSTTFNPAIQSGIIFYLL